MQHLFGPVSSRRLGRSLGIDLIPFKTCSYNCVYCECGPTTTCTINRETYFQEIEIITELGKILKSEPDIDYLTCAGSGEPTLSSSIGEIIIYLKNHYPHYKIAVLTNGSLLGNPGMQRELSSADLVIPTLCTTSQKTFELIHRPYPGLSISHIIDGMVSFCKTFPGKVWLEIFLVPGLNTSPEELMHLKEIIMIIMPDRIQINSLDRPGAEPWVREIHPDEMKNISDYLTETHIPVDIIDRTRIFPPHNRGMMMTGIKDTLRRRPCTCEDLIRISSMHPAELMKELSRLEQEGIIARKRGPHEIFYYLPEEGRNTSFPTSKD